MTDDRLRAAQERVLREMGYRPLEDEPPWWVHDNLCQVRLGDRDWDFLMEVAIPWARERGWLVTVYVEERSTHVMVTDGEAIYEAGNPDPMTALWLVLGEACHE